MYPGPVRLVEASPMIGSVLNAGLEGVHKGMNGLHKTARDMASATTQAAPAPATTQSPVVSQPSPENSLAESMVELRLYEATTQASAKVVKAADEMLGTLIDTFA